MLGKLERDRRQAVGAAFVLPICCFGDRSLQAAQGGIRLAPGSPCQPQARACLANSAHLAPAVLGNHRTHAIAGHEGGATTKKEQKRLVHLSTRFVAYLTRGSEDESMCAAIQKGWFS